MDLENKPQRHSFPYALAVLFVLGFYIFGYGVMRWQKLLVRTVSHYEESKVIYTIERGWYPRRGLMNRVKSRVSPVAAFAYAPMRYVESFCWNLKSQPEPQQNNIRRELPLDCDLTEDF